MLRDPLVLAMLALGVGLRAWWVFESNYGVIDDTLFYHRHAIDLANLDGYRNPATGDPSAFLPPGYPLLLAVPYAIFGDSTRVAGVVNVILAGVTILLVATLARSFFGRWSGALAAFGFAVFPSQILYTSAPHSDLLLTPLVMAVVVAALATRDARLSRGRTIVLGLLFGATVLTAGQAVFLLPGLAIAWGFSVGWREAGRRAALMTAAGALVVLPWVVRNAIQVDAVTVATNGGPNLWIGNNDNADGRWMSWEPTGNEWAYPPDEAAFDRGRRNDAIKFMVTRPLDAISLWPSKLLETFNADFSYVGHFSLVPHEGQLREFMDGERLERYLDSWFRSVLAAGVAAAVILMAIRHRGAVLVPVALSLVAVPVIFFGLDRYHVPLLPILTVLASSLVSVVPAYVLRGVFRRRSGAAATSTATPGRPPVAARS